MGVARFNGSAVFAPGPTRFVDGWLGQGFAYPFAEAFEGGYTTQGVLGRGVSQTGRLVLASAALLQGRIETIRGLAEVLTEGTLDAGDGRTWAGMTMLQVRFEGPVGVGRMWSVGYRIEYAELA